MFVLNYKILYPFFVLEYKYYFVVYTLLYHRIIKSS